MSDGCDFGGVLGSIRSRDRVVGEVSVAAPLAEAGSGANFVGNPPIETDNNQNARIAP